jgi:hypothetical protein
MQWRLHENVSCAASHSTLHNARDIIDSLTAHGPKAKLMFYHEVISSDDFKVRFTSFFYLFIFIMIDVFFAIFVSIFFSAF